jgi:SAM-dependent methyltransferase
MEETPRNQVDPHQATYTQEQIAFWNDIARELDVSPSWGNYYHQRLTEVYKFLVGRDLRILEVGCGQGDLLAALHPKFGVGVDFSGEMLQRAKRLHPDLHFVLADAHELFLNCTFDIVILSDLVNNLWDVQTVLERLTPLLKSRTRVLLNFYSRLWEMPLLLAKKLGLAQSVLGQNWLTIRDISNLLALADLEILRHWEEFLWPLSTPVVDTFCNRFLVKIWPFNWLALTNFVIARPIPKPRSDKQKPLVSVIVPARNEAGNIDQIFQRAPELGGGTELVFVEGHSQDNTYETIEQVRARHPERRCQLWRQTGVGKGNAVRLGFARAQGEVLMILDADLTVPPEDLPRILDVLLSGKGELVNGVRLVYPMQKQAMRYLNLVGNKFFSLAFTWLMGQPVKDTLCGTKALFKTDYELIAANREYFGDFDPFGDFDLLFGAAKLNLKIVDLPIRYRDRTYGDTNIQRWKQGWLLIKMVWFAARRLKFV